ncbi:MAG: hypothetical protein ACREQJ_01665 [Candidatus Binatia bacterium]
MGHAIDTLRSYFENNGLHYNELDGNDETARIGWVLGAKSARYEVHAQDLTTGHLWIYVTAPIRVPERLRTRVAELLAWLNFGLRWGAFEIDPNDGELRHRSGGLVPQGEAGHEIVEDLYKQSCQIMEDFFPLLSEGTFSSDPVDVTYRRLNSAMSGGDPKPAAGADVSEVLAAVDEIGRRAPELDQEVPRH